MVNLNYRGLPYYEYGHEISMLLRLNRTGEAEKLLNELIAIADMDTSDNKFHSSKWYYAALANLYHKKGDLASEAIVLERFVRNNKGERTLLHERLERLKK